jgi:NAD(P)-dependent dehydrogenase (short-subunit alcohol dehydrogenase family)
MTASMDGKVAVVTGAGSGIGRASAEALAVAGASVVVADIAVPGGEETLARIQSEGGTAVFQETDIADDEQVARMVARAISEFGRLDCAHNNAGVVGDLGPLEDCPRDSWDRTVAVNLTGTWNCLRHEIPLMLEGGAGSIVNTASTFGVVGVAQLSSYVATKHGVVGLTRAAALDHAEQRIRVNAVCPGVIDTPMLDTFLQDAGDDPEAVAAQFVAGEPMARMGLPKEIAAAVLWLCSDASSFVTGQALPVDGGWTTQ